MTEENCHFCGAEEPIERHHIVPRRLGGSDKDNNLLSVCSNCHSKLEKIYNNNFYAKIGVNTSTDRSQLALYECSHCSNKFIGKLSIIPNCPRCNFNDQVNYISRVTETFTVLNIPGVWKDLEFSQRFIIWFKYSSRDEIYTYPKGSNSRSFRNKVDAYEQLGKIIEKDIVEDAGITYVESVSEIDEVEHSKEVVKKVLGNNLTESPKKLVYSELAKLSNEDNVLPLEELFESIDMPDSEIKRLLDKLKGDGEVFQPREGVLQLI